MLIILLFFYLFDSALKSTSFPIYCILLFVRNKIWWAAAPPRERDEKMESEKNYATPWLERREKSEQPDEEFIEMLEEIFRGRVA